MTLPQKMSSQAGSLSMSHCSAALGKGTLQGCACPSPAPGADSAARLLADLAPSMALALGLSCLQCNPPWLPLSSMEETTSSSTTQRCCASVDKTTDPSHRHPPSWFLREPDQIVTEDLCLWNCAAPERSLSQPCPQLCSRQVRPAQRMLPAS